MKMTLKKHLHAAVLMAFTSPVMVEAAVEFDQGVVPEEFVLHLLNGGTFYRSLPDGFPVPSVLPAGVGFWVLGSHVGPQIQRVILQTNVNVQQVLQGLRQAYLSDGWIDLSTSDTSQTLCNDALGMLMLRESNPGGLSRIDAMLLPTQAGMPPQLSCLQRQALGGDGDPSLVLAQSLMPVLTMPDTAVVISSPGQFGSFGSSGGHIHLDYSVSILMPDTDSGLLYGHFAQMMQEQDWSADSSDVGASSSASIWFKSAELPADDSEPVQLPLSAIMVILDQGGGLYQLKFTLQTFVGITGGLGIRGIPSTE